MNRIQYLLIGNGRLATHLRHYFSLLNLPFETWHRNQPSESLNQKIKQATHILLLISDHAIEEFIIQHLSDNNAAYIIHFSGSHVSERAYGAHPLMTFSHQLYDLEKYRSIPFILDTESPHFEVLLPGLPNPFCYLTKSLKAKYHALCVLSGNFSCMLWQKLFSDFEKDLNLPATIAQTYLLQQTENLITNFSNALTGPLVRNDMNTIEKNLKALNGDPFEKVYVSFVECYQQLQKRN